MNNVSIKKLAAISHRILFTNLKSKSEVPKAPVNPLVVIAIFAILATSFSSIQASITKLAGHGGGFNSLNRVECGEEAGCSIGIRLYLTVSQEEIFVPLPIPYKE